MVSRLERTSFAAWWWTVDRLLLAALLALMLAGIVLSLAASPPVASRLGLEPFYFVNRHVLYLVPALVGAARDLVPAAAICPPALAGGVRAEPRAHRRHPAFRCRSEGRAPLDRPFRGQPAAVGVPQACLRHPDRLAVRRIRAPAGNAGQCHGACAARAVDQPASCCSRISGRPCWSRWSGAHCSFSPGCGWSGWPASAARPRSGSSAPTCSFRMSRDASSASAIPHPGIRSISTRRSNPFNAAAGSEGDRARERSSAFCPRAIPTSCSRSRPRSSASCCACCCSSLFTFIVLRALRHAMRNEDPFARFATAGLAILFGLQSAINMGVNLHLMPAKGMTLPFISYGGSSMISLAYGMGMLLALTRERPRAELLASHGGFAAAGSRGPMSDGDGAPLVLLAAGGTGGHLFPAEALAQALTRRGVTVDLATDDAGRALRQANSRPAKFTSSRARPCGDAIRYRWRAPPQCWASAACRPCACSDASSRRAVVGFGGYPTVPPVLAARLRRIPTLIHEQNAVMGRANRFLAPRVTRNRDRLCRRARARAAARRQIDTDRQSGPAAGDRGGGNALRGAGGFRSPCV